MIVDSGLPHNKLLYSVETVLVSALEINHRYSFGFPERKSGYSILVLQSIPQTPAFKVSK